MALILHQSGHGHSHGGLASHGHGHKKGRERHPASDHTHQGGDPADAEQNRAVDGTVHGREDSDKPTRPRYPRKAINQKYEGQNADATLNCWL